MAKKHLYREIKSEINIVPLLDVLLVLVLICIATTPIITPSIEVDLPSKTDSKNYISNDNLPVILEVSGIGQYRLVADHQFQKRLLSKQVISEARAYITVNPKRVFLIGGAKDVPYDEIIKALNLLSKAGVKSVGLMTRPI